MKQLHYGFKFNNNRYSITKGLYYVLCPIFENVQKAVISHKITLDQLRKMHFDYLVTYTDKYTKPSHIMFVFKNGKLDTGFDTVAYIQRDHSPKLYLGIDQTEIAQRYPYTDSCNRANAIHVLNEIINAERKHNTIQISKISRALDNYRDHLLNWMKQIQKDLEKSNSKPKLPKLVSALSLAPAMLTLKSRVPNIASFTQNEPFCTIYELCGRGFNLLLSYRPDKSRLLDANIQINLPLDFDADQLADVIYALDNLQNQNRKFIKDEFPELKEDN